MEAFVSYAPQAATSRRVLCFDAHRHTTLVVLLRAAALVSSTGGCGWWGQRCAAGLGDGARSTPSHTPAFVRGTAHSRRERRAAGSIAISWHGDAQQWRAHRCRSHAGLTSQWPSARQFARMEWATTSGRRTRAGAHSLRPVGRSTALAQYTLAFVRTGAASTRGSVGGGGVQTLKSSVSVRSACDPALNLAFARPLICGANFVISNVAKV